MAEFINTSAAIGDDALVDSIIMRTITEYKEDRITTVGQCAFYGCTALTTLDLPNVTYIDINAFNGCTSLVNVCVPALERVYLNAFESCATLEKIDLPAVKSIFGAAFRVCSKLVAVIIRRNDSVVALASSTVFHQTPIATGTGYIYVPSALVDSYKAATNWSTYAARIRAIEDYPDITGG